MGPATEAFLIGFLIAGTFAMACLGPAILLMAIDDHLARQARIERRFASIRERGADE